jgi:hypothetical protein
MSLDSLVLETEKALGSEEVRVLLEYTREPRNLAICSLG